MTIFYAKDIAEGVHILSEEESKHCSQVLRHKSGDEILIYDGNGGKYRVILTQVSKKSCSFDIIESKIEPSKSFSIHLAIAPTKSADRMEWMIEKLCEVGVDELTFIQCQHSERRKLRLDRFKKKAVSAMKQSGNPFKLKVNELVRLTTFIASDSSDQKMIAHVDASYATLGAQISPSKKISLLIGPEGGFSKEELKLALDNNYLPVTLGKNTLRTETAGFVACCQVNFVNGF